MLDVSSENLLQSIFHTLAYADVFDYPLTALEVQRYLTSHKASWVEVQEALGCQTLFYQAGDYFTLRGREGIIETRKRREKIAARLWGNAARYGRMIARLPFVRMVAVTGSLSMNNTEEGTDIDFMIVTAPRRLWTCRALSLLVARLAKLEGVTLCPNYLVTTNALELKERSLYVAHEVAQMIPLSGMDVYHEMRRLNAWIDEFLPNASAPPDLPKGAKPIRKHSRLQKGLESVSRLPVVDWFEWWEMNRKVRRLRREQSASFESYFSEDVCKGHIDRHGENIGAAFASRLGKAA